MQIKLTWKQLKELLGVDGVEPDQVILVNDRIFEIAAVHEDGVNLVPVETDEEE